MKVSLQRWLGWLLLPLALALPRSVLAAGFEDALLGMASDDRDRLEAAITELGSLPDPRALAVLQALEAGNLRVEPSGGVFIQSQNGVIDARTGKPGSPVDTLKEPPVNNRLRRNLALAIARVRPHDAPGARRLALLGVAFFSLQTALLDALLWPAYFPG